MRFDPFESWLLLLVYLFVVSDALTIPLGARNDLVSLHDAISRNIEAVDLDRRAKPKSQPKPVPKPNPVPNPPPKPTNKAPTPKSTSAKAVPLNPTTPSPVAKPTGVSKCSTSGKVTVCPSSSVGASRIKLEVPHPTKAYDACNLPGIDCFGDFDGFTEVKDPEVWDVHEVGGPAVRSVHQQYEASLGHRSTLHDLQKRGDRSYDVFSGLIIESLGYPSRDKIFTDSRAKKRKLQAHAYQFKPNQGIGEFVVEDLKKTPTGTAIQDFVVEHIIELQTVKMFINDAVTNSKIDKNFFLTWWNKNLDYNLFYSRPANPQAPIANWPVPKAKAPKVALPDKWRTLNNLVFNALGSAANREDFVLCDMKINGMKEKLWSDKQPMDMNEYDMYSKAKAQGALTSDVHLSAIRLVLGVFKYFEDPVVATKLKSEIKHAGVELTSANIAHLTSNQITNIDLQPLWQKYMETKLQNIEKTATEWVDKAIKSAEGAYKTELDGLLAQEKKLMADQNNPAQQKKYNDQRIAIETQARKLKQDMHNADKRRDDAEDALKKAAATHKSTDKQVTNAKNELETAKTAALNAEKEYNLKMREGNKLDLTEVRQMIKNAKDDQAVLAKFKAYNKSFKMPSAK